MENQSVDLSPLHILLVDGDEDFMQAFTRFLETFRAKVTTCTSPSEASDLIATKAFNVAMLAIQMPHGYDLIKAIRAHPDPLVNKLPVIGLMGVMFPPERKSSMLMAGFNQCFKKTAHKAEFLNCLQTYANERGTSAGE